MDLHYTSTILFDWCGELVVFQFVLKFKVHLSGAWCWDDSWVLHSGNYMALSLLMAGAMWNCCNLGICSVYTMQSCTSLQSHFIWSHICRVHVWDLFFNATAVTQEWNRHWNKSLHRKLTLEKKFLQLGFEPMTFQSWVQRSIIELSLLPAQFFFLLWENHSKFRWLDCFLTPEHVIFPVKLFVVCKLFIVELNNMWDKCEHFSKCKFLRYHFSQLFAFFVFISNMTRIKYKFMCTCGLWPRAIASSNLFSYQSNLLMTDHWKSEAKWSRCCCDGISFGKLALLRYPYLWTLSYSLLMRCENKWMKHYLYPI